MPRAGRSMFANDTTPLERKPSPQFDTDNSMLKKLTTNTGNPTQFIMGAIVSA
jgi:hypothetical protein